MTNVKKDVIHLKIIVINLINSVLNALKDTGEINVMKFVLRIV